MQLPVRMMMFQPKRPIMLLLLLAVAGTCLLCNAHGARLISGAGTEGSTQVTSALHRTTWTLHSASKTTLQLQQTASMLAAAKQSVVS